MFRRSAVALGTGIWLTAVAALAQEEQEQEATPVEAGEGQEQQVEPPQATPEAAPRGASAAPGEVHTVVRGDTLWDLSQRYLGNSWYWPKVWSYNPEIANPHWIYPGNNVRFFPGGDEAPMQVEAGEAISVNGDDMGGDVTPGELLGDVEYGDEGPGVVVVGKIGYTPKETRRIIQDSFVTARELEEAGTVSGSFSPKLMLSYPDPVYLRFKNRGNVKLGEKYVIFRTLGSVRHPISGRTFGFLTKLTGTVKVTALGENVVTAQIMESWDEIRRSDMVGPYGEQLVQNVAPKANQRELQGHVVANLVPYLALIGEHHSIVIDKGSQDGVAAGNTFTIVRQAEGGGNIMNPASGQDGRLPLEDIGQCMVVVVKETASTCLLTRTLVDITPGDRAVMRISMQPRASLR